MEQNLSRYQSLIILFITLLLHAGILIALIIIQFDQPQTEAMVLLAENHEPQPEHMPQNNWVSTTQSMPIVPQQAMQQHSSPPLTSENNQTEQFDKAPPLSEEPSYAKAPADEQIQNAVSLAQKLLAHAKKYEVEKKENKREPKEVKEESVNEKNIKKTPITLAQLTQGFMQHLQESPMTVRSNQQGKASMEQLQQMHYMQKIIACIVNSYKILNNSNLHGQMMQQARVQMALNKDGTIHTLQLVQSSGNMTIDQFLIFMFKDASSSFPPLPSSCKEQTFHLPVFNVDRLESFQSSNGWYIDNSMQ